jgi:hypothetical protein
MNQGLVNPGEFSAIVAMVLITTIVTPPILRSLFARDKRQSKRSTSEDESVAAAHDPQHEETN